MKQLTGHKLTSCHKSCNGPANEQKQQQTGQKWTACHKSCNGPANEQKQVLWADNSN